LAGLNTIVVDGKGSAVARKKKTLHKDCSPHMCVVCPHNWNKPEIKQKEMKTFYSAITKRWNSRETFFAVLANYRVGIRCLREYRLWMAKTATTFSPCFSVFCWLKKSIVISVLLSY